MHDLSSVTPRLQQVSMWRWFTATDYWTAFALAREAGCSIDDIVATARAGASLTSEDVERERDTATQRQQVESAGLLVEQVGVVVMRRLTRQMLDSFWCHVQGWHWVTPPGRARWSVIDDMREAMHDSYRDRSVKIFLVQFAETRYLTPQFPSYTQTAA